MNDREREAEREREREIERERERGVRERVLCFFLNHLLQDKCKHRLLQNLL